MIIFCAAYGNGYMIVNWIHRRFLGFEDPIYTVFDWDDGFWVNFGKFQFTWMFSACCHVLNMGLIIYIKNPLMKKLLKKDYVPGTVEI